MTQKQEGMPGKRTFPLVFIPLAAFMAIGTVWLRLAIVDTTYAIHQLEETTRALRQEKAKAELRLATEKSPRRLEHLARTRYHLAPPRTDQVVHLR
jgi:hypothetical protein